MVFAVVVISDCLACSILELSYIVFVPWQAVSLLPENVSAGHCKLELGELGADGAIDIVAQTVVRSLVLESGDGLDCGLALFPALTVLNQLHTDLLLLICRTLDPGFMD